VGTLLGTLAPNEADWVLLFEFAVGALLILGMFLVRRGHVRAHMYIQGSMILVNIPVVLAWMIPEYGLYVAPGLPGELAQTSYWVPTVMLVAGAIAEALGIYIILVAASTLIPERFRFRNYKLWMRTELILWWAVLITGVATYYVWYVQT
jgi:uncharacterized membrane protein YozB (DUF420 family)